MGSLTNRETQISLSLLEYESDLLKHLDQFKCSKVFSQILELVVSGKLYSLHIDVMRPPLISNRSAFPIELIRRIYENLHERITLEIHLMVKEPELLIEDINKFVEPDGRTEVSMIIQREAYGSEEEVIKTLRAIKTLGYRAGIGLNLPTPFKSLTEEIIKNADLVLIMSVPMGKGGQKYDDQATERIKVIASRFPDKPIKVDGGINDKTVQSVKKAGAKILVIGSFVSMSKKPLAVLENLERMLENPQNF